MSELQLAKFQRFLSLRGVIAPATEAAKALSTAKSLHFSTQQDEREESTITVDLDGTLAEDLPKPFDPTQVGAPRDGAIEFVEALKKLVPRVVILTAREYLEPVRKWVRENGVPVDGVTNKKIPAICHVDNDGVQATGPLSGVLKAVQKFLAKKKTERPAELSTEFSTVGEAFSAGFEAGCATAEQAERQEFSTRGATPVIVAHRGQEYHAHTKTLKSGQHYSLDEGKTWSVNVEAAHLKAGKAVKPVVSAGGGGVDASGHAHKAAGTPEGGQFTAKGEEQGGAGEQEAEEKPAEPTPTPPKAEEKPPEATPQAEPSVKGASPEEKPPESVATEPKAEPEPPPMTPQEKQYVLPLAKQFLAEQNQPKKPEIPAKPLDSHSAAAYSNSGGSESTKEAGAALTPPGPETPDKGGASMNESTTSVPSSPATRIAEMPEAERPILNSPPSNVPDKGIPDAEAVAAKHGRKLRGSTEDILALLAGKKNSFTRNLGFGKKAEAKKDMPKVGEVIQRKDGPWLVTSVGEPVYYTRDQLEDFDMFGQKPGWQAGYHMVPVEPNKTEAGAMEAKTSKAKTVETVESLLASWWNTSPEFADRSKDLPLSEFPKIGLTVSSSSWKSGSNGSFTVNGDLVGYYRSVYDDSPVERVVRSPELAEKIRKAAADLIASHGKTTVPHTEGTRHPTTITVTTPEESEFQAKLKTDKAARGPYADWLEEHGRTADAAEQRKQIDADKKAAEAAAYRETPKGQAESEFGHESVAEIDKHLNDAAWVAEQTGDEGAAYLARVREVREEEAEAAKREAAAKAAKEAVKKKAADDPGSVRIDFGKHSGKRISQVPMDYLRWAAEAGAGRGDVKKAIKAFVRG